MNNKPISKDQLSQNEADMELSAGTLASVPRDPLHWGPGAYIADSDEIIRSWLQRHGVDAVPFRPTEIDVVIGLVKQGQFDWIALASAGRALTMPWFDGLLRATVETDTMLWTADDDTEFGLHLFLSMIENWEFLTPYVPDSTESTSLTSVRDALSRIEVRLKGMPSHKKDDATVETPLVTQQVEEACCVRDGLVLDRYTVFYDGKECFLGDTIQYRLLTCLAGRPTKWFTYSELRSNVWQDAQTDDGNIGRTIRFLRDKLRKSNFALSIENPRNMKHHVRLILF